VSAPNKNFDPVMPAALDPANLQAGVDAALAAIASAQDLAALKDARLAHSGDRSPAGPGQP
jgi:phenylalanyl-tRNA synthetase alpha chain